jgi:nitrogen fixation protein NifB
MASCPSSSKHPAGAFSLLQASKVAHHPCYSPTGRHRFARMHLAVAPACNLQCNYCNRKFDCSNESRPGVVSELLSPKQAIAKACQVAAELPQLSVIGIAGPGDPLANMARTFNTLEGLRSALPDMKLCLSTNGIGLPDAVDQLVELGVDHVTVTVNALDALIASKIYAWLWLDGERYHGVEAGQILLQRQAEGIRKLAERGVLVKVNSVLIPGINDHHMQAISEQAKEWGAFLHNIMPLIAKPEHGTVFGLNGQPEPDEAMLTAVRQQCGQTMPQMTHCQQCRADAIGMLGEDKSQSFSLASLPAQPQPYLPVLFSRTKVHASIATRGESEEPDASLVAVATQSGAVIDQHFGHADRFHIYSVSQAGVIHVGERFTPRYCHGQSECEPETQPPLESLLSLLSDVQAVFCARIGLHPWQALEKMGIEPVSEGAWQAIPEVLMQWWQTRQKKDPSAVSDRGVA